MAQDTFQSVWNRVLLRCPLADPSLAQDWVRNVFREIVEKRTWSWSLKYNQFLFQQVYNTGTVSVTFNNPTVIGTGTAWTTAIQGRQFRLGVQSPIYTILSVNVSTQTLILSNDGVNAIQWGGNTQSGAGYQVYNAYQPVQSDFKEFQVVWDPLRNWKLRTNVTQPELNLIDPQRANLGPSYAVVNLFYQSYPSQPGIAQFEFWPHQQAQYVLPYIYVTQPPDISDPGTTIPRMVRGDILLEGALAMAARWPGPSEDKPNIYFNLGLALAHQARYDKMVQEIEVKDDAIYEQDVIYQFADSLPFSIVPLFDSNWLQSHAI